MNKQQAQFHNLQVWRQHDLQGWNVPFEEEEPQRLIVALPGITPTTSQPIITQEADPPAAASPRPPQQQSQIVTPICPRRPIPRATPRREPAVFDPPARNTRSHTQGRLIVTEVMLLCIDIGQVKMDPKKLVSQCFPKEVINAVLGDTGI